MSNGTLVQVSKLKVGDTIRYGGKCGLVVEVEGGTVWYRDSSGEVQYLCIGSLTQVRVL